MKALDVLVFELIDDLPEPLRPLVRVALSDPHFVVWTKAQQQAARDHLSEIDPRSFSDKPEEYHRVAMDLQLLCRFWGDLTQYAENLRKE